MSSPRDPRLLSGRRSEEEEQEERRREDNPPQTTGPHGREDSNRPRSRFGSRSPIVRAINRHHANGGPYSYDHDIGRFVPGRPTQLIDGLRLREQPSWSPASPSESPEGYNTGGPYSDANNDGYFRPGRPTLIEGLRLREQP